MKIKFKKVEDASKKIIRKAFYRDRITGYKRVAALMILGGILASLCYTVKYQYVEYAVSRAHVSMVYPEIANSEYPDGSRFTYYDLISIDRLNEALEIMQERGKYENFTAQQLQDQFYVYSYLEESVRSNVSYMRSEGNDYSYVANEYLLSFVQPHDYKNKNWLKKIFTPDDSSEFLTVLMEVNNRWLSENFGGFGGFSQITELEDMSGYDYDEKIAVYKTKIVTIIDYLDALNNNSSGYSTESGTTFQDLIGSYKMLSSEKLDPIANFIDSSGLTADLEMMTNKLNINLETSLLNYNKLDDEALINNYAKTAYDHTFTENLIVVAYDDADGLYQARPKTAFDTVVEQYHDSKNAAVEEKVKIQELEADKANYSAITALSEEYLRLCAKCEELQAEFEQEYLTLGEKAKAVVSEYLSDSNEGYLKSKVSKKELFPQDFLLKLGISFVLGAMLIFIAHTGWLILKDRQKLRKKTKILRKIRNDE